MNLKLALGGIMLGLATLSAAGDASPGKPKVATYSAKAVYALAFHGVRLGMTFEEVCRTLTGQGYTRRPFDFPDDPACSPKHVDDEELNEDYFGQGWNKPEDIAGKPIAQVKFIGVTYLRMGSQRVVMEISVYTDEPRREEALERQVIAEWGIPTEHDRWGYKVLTYAPSKVQANFYNRSKFRSCSLWDGCDSNTGTSCRRILNHYAVPYARQVIYDWGRHIEIVDGRMVLEQARLSGLLDRMLAKNVSYACVIPTVH